MARMNKNPLVAVTILNWNGRHWLSPCLDSVLATNYENFRVYLMDNGSTDGSQELIHEKYPSVIFTQSPKNLGAAEGCNVNIRRALKDGADYVVLLDNDTKVDPNWLAPLVKAAEADPTAGIISPMHWDYEGKGLNWHIHLLLRSKTSYEEDLQKGKLQSFYETECVSSAAMMMSRSVCEQVGLFDPLYFIYYEEPDLCRRALYHGFRVGVFTGSRIFHYDNTYHLDIKQQRRSYYFVRSKLLYFWKNPNESAWTKLKGYLWWGFPKNFTKNTGWPRDLRDCVIIAYMHLWVFWQLPGILWRTRQERRGSMYL